MLKVVLHWEICHIWQIAAFLVDSELALFGGKLPIAGNGWREEQEMAASTYSKPLS